MELAEYDFRIEFIPGKVNDVADGLSRLIAAEPAPERESIEFRDYLRDHEVMSLELASVVAARIAHAAARAFTTFALILQAAPMPCESTTM